MAIKSVEMDRKDFEYFRKLLRAKGFVSSNYFSTNGFNLGKMRKMAQDGNMDAVRCAIGKTIRWYYSEQQAELARLRGEA